MLEAKNISKSYTLPGQQTIPILRGINLSLREGEMVTVIGASGSGKTTLLNMLGTLDTPDGGEILFDGELLFMNKKYTLSQKKLAKFRNRKIGFVFQFHHLLSDFNALENVAMPEFIATGKLQPAKNHAGELLAGLGLSERFDHLPSELSGGEPSRSRVWPCLLHAVLLSSTISQEMHQTGYERFRPNNRDDHLWRWGYRGGWHQSFPPLILQSIYD